MGCAKRIGDCATRSVAHEDENSPAAYLSPLRTALIDRNDGHVNIVVCESDYLALKQGIEKLTPGMQ